MKALKKILALLTISFFLAVPLVSAQDVPLPPSGSGLTGDTAPATSVPFGTGIDMLILLAGGFFAKKYRDSKLKK